jgi:DNA (cytosine-5)-methyltransferase 1
MIRLGTVFSGIGAIEQALKQLKIEHKVVFACDNGERELDLEVDKIIEIIDENPSKDKQEVVQNLYNETNKENLVKKSYMANYGDNLEHWFEDIRFLDGTQFENQLDILVGGSPCQSFSTYGKKLGLEDTRGTLFYDYARLVKEIKPKFFIFENVSGMLSHDKGRTWEVIKDVFTSLHYGIYYQILDAQNFNLPQMRRRLFVVGIRHDLDDKSFKFPEPMKLDVKIDDFLESSIPNKYYLPEKGFNYVTQRQRNEGRARVNREVIGCQTANQQFNWTGDFRIEKPTQRLLDDPRIHKGEFEGKLSVARKLTPSECLNLMGINDFKIVVPDQVMYRQVGNSIAVPVLKALVTKILEVLK